jgi:hypothetical protein
MNNSILGFKKSVPISSESREEALKPEAVVDESTSMLQNMNFLNL